MTKDRTDHFSDQLGELGGSLLGPGFKSIKSGWLAPEAAWAFYWQNGTIRQMINRFTTLMVKAGWDYSGADVKFNWTGVQSELESKRIKQHMRVCATWAFVFGGGAIEHLVEDADRGRDTELDLALVRGYKGMKVWSAYELRPEQGRNYKTAEWFTRRGYGDRSRIHRSRLSIMVSTDVPVTNLGSSLFINSQTGWPPSWLEGVYDPYCDWARAHANATQILRSKSILHLMLDGYRLVSQSPDTPEAQALANNLTQIMNDLDNTGLLVTDLEDTLSSVERSLSGISDVLERKSLRAASASGVPKELFIMEAEGNLGTDSAPYDAYNDMVDGWRDVMTTPTIEKSTDIELRVEQYNAGLKGEALEIPTIYTVEPRPIQEQDAKAKAATRKDESIARKNDGEQVPQEAILSDPSLARDYPELPAILEDRREAAELAKVASVEAEADDPAGEDMVSAGEVARKVNLSPTTVNKMANAGALPGRKIAGRWKFYLSRVIAAIKAGAAPVEQLDAAWGTVDLDRLTAVLDSLEEWTVHNMLAHPLMSVLEVHGFATQAEALHNLTIPEPISKLSDPRAFAAWLAGAIERLSPSVAVGGVGLSAKSKFGDAFGQSVAMREIFAVLERVADSDLAVLLLGETGTGKGGIASGLHRGGEFVAVNCAALPADPAELVDVVRGEMKRARGGTLFLDEIGDLPYVGQSALLAELGDLKARLISATSLDVSNPDKFRPDLLNRLAQVEVEIPPLRDREEDVHTLARMFYAERTKDAGIAPADPPFTQPALAAMLVYPWPGNVRELLNAVARGAQLAGHAKSIGPEHMQLRMTGRG